MNEEFVYKTLIQLISTLHITFRYLVFLFPITQPRRVITPLRANWLAGFNKVYKAIEFKV